MKWRIQDGEWHSKVLIIFWWTPRTPSLHQVLCECMCTCIRVFSSCVCGIFTCLCVRVFCVSVYLYVCVHVSLCGMFMCLYIMCVGYVHVFIYMYAGVFHVFVCMYVLCVCVFVCMCACVFLWYVHVFIYVCGGIFMSLRVCMSPFLSILEIPCLLGCFSNFPIKNFVEIVLILKKFTLHPYFSESLFQTRASLFHLLKAVLYAKRLYRQ